jgi:DNA-binding response OmpR family regulator
MQRILVIEDDRFLRKAAGAALRRQGYLVLTADDGETGLRLARAEHPDLVLLDLIMPGMQGFEVLKLLKEDGSTASIPVIILSNLGQDADVKNALEAGAADYLIKANLALDALVGRVKALFEAAAR